MSSMVSVAVSFLIRSLIDGQQRFGAEGQQKHRKDYLWLFVQLYSGSFGEN